MNTRSLLALALLATPTFAHAQTTATESPAAPAQTAPSLPPPPPGAGPDGAPPPGASPSTVAPQPPPGYPAQSAYPQQPPGYGAQPQPYYGQPLYGQPVYGQPVYGGAPPGYGMPRRRVVEYHGGPVPPGATLETHRPMALVVGGAVVFGGLYLLSVLTASGSGGLIACSSSCGGGWLYAPIVGPFVAMGTGTHSTGDQVVLAIDGIFQTAGVVGFVVGMLRTTQVLVFPGFARNDRGPQWAITPGAPGASLGATLSVMRF